MGGKEPSNHEKETVIPKNASHSSAVSQKAAEALNSPT
jgi:hypothetical protein